MSWGTIFYSISVLTVLLSAKPSRVFNRYQDGLRLYSDILEDVERLLLQLVLMRLTANEVQMRKLAF